MMHKKNWITLTVIIIVSYTLITCSDVQQKKIDNPPQTNDRSNYVGSQACITCHSEIYDKHIHTTHYKATQLSEEKKILGSITPPNNTYHYDNTYRVNVEKKKDSVYQMAYANNNFLKQQSINIIFGAGKHAQSYASWSDDIAVQLPLTYFVNKQAWSNSPGYPNKIVFNRVITSRCMECHTTYVEIKEKSGYIEKYNKNTIMYGVDCEKCHGPASQHVAYQTKNPDDTIGKYIISTKTFSREQKIDMCALCHSGPMHELQEAFRFKPGDKLSDFYAYNIVASTVDNLDVHGNQYGMLSLSKCFIQSELTCNSCHNVHENEEGQKKALSQKCINCHNNKHNSFCTIKNEPPITLEDNCIDCHMPNKSSNAIVFTASGTKQKEGVKMTTHLIKVYPEETKKVVAFINNTKH